MVEYTDIVTTVLKETAKYLGLLVFVVLAIRSWRMVALSKGSERSKWALVATIATGAATGVGYVGFQHSLSRLNYYYASQALDSGRALPAIPLFEKSLSQWRSADALGRLGVCYLWTGQAEQGLKLIAQARTLRRHGDTFEDFYEGVYWLYGGRPEKAGPLLDSASTDAAFHWNAIVLLAALDLDQNKADAARERLRPFASVKVQSAEHAYIMASLRLAEGKKDEARAMLTNVVSTNLPPFWSQRYEKLHAKLQDTAP